VVNPKAVAAMQQLGYNLTSHTSKSLHDVAAFAPFDAVVTMGCGDACPWMPAKQYIDWQIPDPKHLPTEAFNEVRDLLSKEVKNLLQKLGVTTS
jgi:protein-tyrosine-phosphatase